MAGNTGEVRLSSKDLELLLNASNVNLDNLDYQAMDPSLVQQLQSLRQSQSVDPNMNTVAQSRAQPRPRPNHLGRQPPRGTHIQGPWVEITEQPRGRGLRFRYECEGRSAGSIPGESSTPERKVFPTIKIHNYNGPAVIVVSCVTKDEPFKPHPHNLVGKDCKKGVCTLRIRDTTTVSFPHLGIQCAKKKDVDGNLKMRQDINVDPFQTGFKHKGQNIDLNVVRLCFQVFLPDDHGKITRIVPPVVSQPIHDKKALNDLVICRIDRTSGKPKGGDEVFLLCEKINRDDIRVRFYEERDGQVVWEGFGDFGQNDVHRQYAVVFKTPPYKDQFLTQPLDVFMQLQRSSDLEGSEPLTFTYQPEDQDPDRILEKRKRKAADLNFLQEPGGSGISNDVLKQRLKLKATRTAKPESVSVKQEIQSPGLPQYSFTNTGSQKSALEMSGAMATTSMLPDQLSAAPMETASTVTQAGLSGGKLQYTPVSSQQPAVNPIPSVTLNSQLLQLLAASGLVTPQQPVQQNQMAQQQTSQSNVLLQQQIPQLSQSNPGFQQQPGQQGQDAVMSSQIELLKQFLMQAAQAPQQQSQNVDNPVLTNNDPNLQQAQNQDMPSLGSFDSSNFLQMIQDTSMGSFESFSELGTNLDYDPNVAGFETVGADAQNQDQQQQQYDEASTAVQNLNQQQ